MGDLGDFQRRIAEYALGAVRGKSAVHINFLMDITELCDCVPFTQPLIARDIGILASRDPIALDKASLDLFEEDNGPVFRKSTNPEIQLLYGERIGLGEIEYDLIEV